MASEKRIASLLASGTEIVHALGLSGRLAAISHECDFPAEVLDRPRVTAPRIDAGAGSREIDTQVQDLVASGAALYRVDADTLARVAPDVIITQSHCDVCAVSFDDVVAAVAEREELRHARVVALNPTSLRAIYEDVERVGEATGCVDAARACVARFRERVEAVRARTAGLEGSARPRVACVEWTEPLMVAGNWMPELIELAGGTAGVTEGGRPSGYTEWNAVRAFDPEVIVVAPCGFDLERTKREAGALWKLPGWDGLSAVQRGRVVAADGNAYFNRSGPRIIDTLEILAGLIQPKLFADSVEDYGGVTSRLGRGQVETS